MGANKDIVQRTMNGEVTLGNGNSPDGLSKNAEDFHSDTNGKKATKAQTPVVISVNGVDAVDDPFALPELQEDQETKWSELSTKAKAFQILRAVAKISILLLLLYLFICSLDFLGSAFRLVGGKKAGEVFQNSALLKNPVVGLMIGVLATLLVQSSSTSTSIVVTMVGSGIITVGHAVPIIMGANIGTSVTNTIVSLTQAADREEFRRAFAAATVHDMFNWLTVIVLLPIEVGTGYLEKLTYAIVDSQDWEQNKNLDKEMLKKLTKPFTSLIIQLDKKVLEDIAVGNNMSDSANKSFIKTCFDKKSNESVSCGFLLEGLPWSDSMVGLLLLVISLAVLCTCLILMVKVLHSMLRGRIAVVIKKVMNTDPRFPFSILVGYVAIIVGCCMTILVQSSSIFTSALTPLAGIGIISLERMYPLTLGSNIGTTTTSILAAFAAPGNKLKDTLQIAFCHLFFNVTGILIYYPIPFMRFPIPLAKMLGNTTAKYRWFSVLYLILMFIVVPIVIFGLSIAGNLTLMIVGIPFLIIVFLVALVNILQRKRPSLLPNFLRTWNWLPEWMHSLDPMDRVLSKVFGICKCGRTCSHTKKEAKSLTLCANSSQMNIVETAKMADDKTLNSFENKAFLWSPNKSPSESTIL